MSRVKLGIIGGVVTFVLFFLLAAGLGVSGRKAAKMPVEEILANLAAAANDVVGKKVASNIVVTGASIEAGNHLIYTYRVIGSTQIDQSILDEKTREIWRTACRDRMMRRAMDGGATITFSYMSIKGNEVLAIDVDKSNCR